MKFTYDNEYQIQTHLENISGQLETCNFIWLITKPFQIYYGAVHMIPISQDTIKDGMAYSLERHRHLNL